MMWVAQGRPVGAGWAGAYRRLILSAGRRGRSAIERLPVSPAGRGAAYSLHQPVAAGPNGGRIEDGLTPQSPLGPPSTPRGPSRATAAAPWAHPASAAGGRRAPPRALPERGWDPPPRARPRVRGACEALAEAARHPLSSNQVSGRTEVCCTEKCWWPRVAGRPR